MGPNSFRLLDELIQKKLADAVFDRSLDLGCSCVMIAIPGLKSEPEGELKNMFETWSES